MTRSTRNAGRVAPPALARLFADYLTGQTAAQTDGLGFAEPRGEVEPYEAVPVRPVDPALAWADATAAAGCFAPDPLDAAAPADWAALVAAREPGVDVAFALGNYPQMVRDLHPLLAGGYLAGLRVDAAAAGAPAPALADWAATADDYPRLLVAAGVLRLARRFDEAAVLLDREPPPERRSAHANERAALAWHSGRFEEAAALWANQAESTPVLFNRGMAALFLGDAAAARAALEKAAVALPETGAWHHLARLYLALAAARG